MSLFCFSYSVRVFRGYSPGEDLEYNPGHLLTRLVLPEGADSPKTHPSNADKR